MNFCNFYEEIAALQDTERIFLSARRDGVARPRKHLLHLYRESGYGNLPFVDAGYLISQTSTPP